MQPTMNHDETSGFGRDAHSKVLAACDGLHESIASLDLSRVRKRLQEPQPEGKGWSDVTAVRAEEWYRRFLHLKLVRPSLRVVPNSEIDAFWHQHILDTRAYAKDTEAVFGYFLHHYPYFGLNGDAAERDACFDETNHAYREIFGEDCTSLGPVGSDCSPPCSTSACSGGGTCSACTVDG